MGKFGLLLATMMLIAACNSGSGGNPSGDAKISTKVSGEKFDCHWTKCDSGFQYCLLSRTAGNPDTNAFLSESCKDIPDGCKSCECFEKDAKAQFSGKNNCDVTVSCGIKSQGKSKFISVTCYAPKN